MDLSVIIVCYKGWDKLTLCLESLEKFSGSRFTSEVIIVDNNSGDPALNEIEKRFSNFIFIRNTVNGGYANGCNLGFKSSVGDKILILNPDTVVTEEAIGNLLEEAHKNPGYYIISCRQIRSDGRVTKPWGRFPGLYKKERKEAGEQDLVFFPDWVSGSLMLMSREIFSRLNGFDEDYWMYSEDVDLCRRVRDLGGEIALFNKITIEHNHGGSSRINSRTTSVTKTEVQISRHLYISKHIRGFEKFLMHSLIITDNILTGLIAFIAGLIFFFIPKLFVRVPIFRRLLGYYAGVIHQGRWVSSQSVTYSRFYVKKH